MLSLSVLLPAAALTRYDDHGEPKWLVSERVLLALRRLDWPTALEIFEAAELEPDDGDAGYHALAQLVRAGKARRRAIAHGRYVYQLVPSAFVAKPPPRLDKCSNCPGTRAPGHRMCTSCGEKNRAAQRRNYWATKGRAA